MSSSAETYAELFQRGKRLMANGNFEEAIAAFTRASERQPGSFWPYSHCGESLLLLQRPEEAESMFRQAIERAGEMDEQAFSAQFGLGKALSQQERWDDAIEVLCQATELDPNQFWPAFHLGEAYFQLERWEEAIESFQQANILRGDRFWAHFKVGEAQAKLEQWSDAIQAFNSAREIQPDSFAANFSLAKAYFNAGQWAKAAASFSQANRCKPDDFWSHYHLGESFCKLERWEEAVCAFERAEKLKIGPSLTHRVLTNEFINRARGAEAVVRYQRAIVERPEDFSSHFFLGLALVNANKIKLAIAAFQKSIDLNNLYRPAYEQLGQAYIRLNRFQEAEESLRKAIDISPTAQVWTELGKMMLIQNRTLDSIAAFIQAIAGDRSHTSAYALLGAALEQDGRSADAVAVYHQAQSKGVTDEEIERRLAIIAEKNSPSRSEEDVALTANATSCDETGRSHETLDSNRSLLFVVCNDYGELALAMYLLEGQSFARNTTLMLPPRLYANNPEILPGRTLAYQSVEDIRQEIRQRPSGILGLFSGHLLPTHRLCGSGELDSLLRWSHARGWQSFTTDPFLGLIEGGEERRNLVARRSGNEQSIEDLFIHLLTGTYGTLIQIPHVYPFGVLPTEMDRSAGTRLCFHNPAFLSQPGIVPQTPSEAPAAARALPRWLFVLGNEDYNAQQRLHPGESFGTILIRMLQETLDAGRVPTLVAPVELIDSVRKHDAVFDSMELLPYCEYLQFLSLLRDAEYVFYWNAVSFSGVLRTLLGKPWFTFDRGHLINTMSAEYVARISNALYQGCEPPRLAIDDALTCEALRQATLRYEGSARRSRQTFFKSLDPQSLLSALAPRRRTRTLDKGASIVVR